MAGEVPEAIRRYFDGLNNENWDDFNGIWTEDAELIGVGARPRSGKEDVLTYYSTVLVPYPVHYDDPYAIHVAGDIVTVEIHFTGETHEGVPVEFEAVDVFTMRDGMICRLTTWYDIDAVRKAATRPGAPAARLKTLVRHAAKRSPFYRDRLAAAGVGPEDVAADITTVPPTRAAELVGAELGVVDAKQVAQEITLGGYTLPLTPTDIAENDETLAKALATAGVTASDRILALASQRGLAAAATHLRATMIVPGGADPVAAAAEGKATVLFAPAHADVASFRAQAEATGADLSSVRLVVGTTHDAGGWPHAALWGTPATGAVAAACAAGSRELHVFERHLVEVVDVNGTPVAPGVEGEILVTPLGRRGAPLLRFAPGARGSLSNAPCSCGRPGPLLRVS